MARLQAPQEEIVRIAQQLYKYSNYKRTLIPQKVSSEYYADGSLIALYSILRKYLATSEKDLKRAPNVFFDTIDSLAANHYAKFTPKKDEEAAPYSRQPNRGRPKSSKVKKIRTNEEVETTPSFNSNEKINISKETLQKIQDAKYYIGVKVNDAIKLFDNEDIMKGFISAFSYMENPPTYSKVKITIQEI